MVFDFVVVWNQTFSRTEPCSCVFVVYMYKYMVHTAYTSIYRYVALCLYNYLYIYIYIHTHIITYIIIYIYIYACMYLVDLRSSFLGDLFTIISGFSAQVLAADCGERP